MTVCNNRELLPGNALHLRETVASGSEPETRNTGPGLEKFQLFTLADPAVKLLPNRNATNQIIKRRGKACRPIWWLRNCVSAEHTC